MLRSTFTGINTGRLALLASQNGLDLTGHNIANVKTAGYSRQRLDQMSFNNFNTDLYQSVPTGVHIGYGVEVLGTSQVRDPFLDTRYRGALSNLGTYDRMTSVLTDISDVLDEAGKDALQNEITSFQSALKDLQDNPGESTYNNAVRSSAQKIVEYLNTYSSQLSQLQTQTIENTSTEVNDTVNSLLSQISKLNQTIQTSQTHGNPALELQDQRNQLLDELSTYGDIRVSYTTEDLVTGAQVDIMKLEMKFDSFKKTGTGGTATAGDGYITILEDIQEPAKFTMTTDANNKVSLSLETADGTKYTDMDVHEGTIKGAMEIINSEGVYDSTTICGFGYYQKMLDTFASKFAETFNNLNNYVGVSGVTATADQNLFAPATAGDPITAKNISISAGWLNGSVTIHGGEKPDSATGNIENITKMLTALEAKQSFMATVKNPDGTTAYKEVFKGSFHESMENMSNTLANEIKTDKSIASNYISVANSIADNRDAVMGVSLDEEVVNLMTYNKSFSAASRVISSMEKMLDDILNMV